MLKHFENNKTFEFRIIQIRIIIFLLLSKKKFFVIFTTHIQVGRKVKNVVKHAYILCVLLLFIEQSALNEFTSNLYVLKACYQPISKLGV